MVILCKVLTRNGSANFLIEVILINELTMKSLKEQSNVFLIVCQSLMLITYLPSHVFVSTSMKFQNSKVKSRAT